MLGLSVINIFYLITNIFYFLTISRDGSCAEGGEAYNLSSDKNTKKGSLAKKLNETEDDSDIEDNRPLFWQPGKKGYYSPRPGRNTPERLNAFRNVGRCDLTIVCDVEMMKA